MSGNKWKWAKDEPGKTSPEKIERGGMIVVLCVGLILLVGGLLFEWMIGSFDDKAFFGYEIHYHDRQHRTERMISALLSLPWVAGALMSLAAIKYFRKKQ